MWGRRGAIACRLDRVCFRACNWNGLAACLISRQETREEMAYLTTNMHAGGRPMMEAVGSVATHCKKCLLFWSYGPWKK